MTPEEQMALARARAKADRLEAVRLGTEGYLVRSRYVAPGSYWIVRPRADGLGWACECPASTVCAHIGAVVARIERERGRTPAPQAWRDPVAPRPEPPRRDLTADERARLRVLCTPSLRASANTMAHLLSGTQAPVSEAVRAIADRVTYGDLFPGVE